MFEIEVNNWLKKNQLNHVTIIDDDEFEYDIENRLIHFGVVSTSESVWFEQFLYEYGMNYVGIIPEILAFLHEIGHSLTVDNFNEDDLQNDTTAKGILNFMDYSCEKFQAYWELPMEFAANMWVVDFVNNHIDAVEELCAIYQKYWEGC